jgi:transcriptional regulator with XRE-family HTH domain
MTSVEPSAENKLRSQLGKNLRAIRLARGLSQEQFAQVLQIHRTYMGGVERGERNLTLKTVERMARKLGVEPLELLSRNPPAAGQISPAAHLKQAPG